MNLGRAVVTLLLVATVYYAVFGGEYSLFELRRTRASLVVEREKLAAVRQEIDSLQAWADSLENDPATIERVAREDFGMIREAETLYRFADVDEEEERPAVPER